jgi:signal transduction histidine kinase
MIGFIIALGFAGITLWNTYKLIQRIEDDEKQQMELWGLAQQKLASNKDLNNPIDPLMFQILTTENSIPMIVVDDQNNLLFSNNINQRKLTQDSLGYIQKLKEEFGSEHKPIEITYKDSLYQKMYYGKSNLIYQLRYYPFAFLLIVVFIGGLVYAYYKTNQQAVENKLWTGMAKETAHQLGTPISSLLGWLTILEEDIEPKMLNQIKSDVTRLEIISARFSKIGSLPNRNETKISAIVQDITEYMQIRMPKDIKLELDLIGKEKEVSINPELMGWVLENLIKNSIDAIRGKGKISIELSWDKAALISIHDSGIGIPKKLQRTVFEAGVTTKKRGWGIGLTLAKRIVAQYHGGKLRLVNSSDLGTSFEIQLPIA